MRNCSLLKRTYEYPAHTYNQSHCSMSYSSLIWERCDYYFMCTCACACACILIFFLIQNNDFYPCSIHWENLIYALCPCVVSVRFLNEILWISDWFLICHEIVLKLVIPLLHALTLFSLYFSCQQNDTFHTKLIGYFAAAFSLALSRTLEMCI